MGEAKRRRTKEQQTTGQSKQKLSNWDKMSEYIDTPVDEDLFLFCSNLYSAAAQMRMPVENPTAKPIFESDGNVYAFSDMPINRGMLAVMDELNEQNVPQEIKMSMTWRIMQFGEVLSETEKFSKWMRFTNEEGTMEVAESLIRACAKAKMVMTKENASFDLDDVERLAIEITARLESEDASSKKSR
jgi:hypothetical protein